MRPRVTELDYAIIAVAPALIMVLVGSLMLFAVGLFYHGPHSFRLNWITCMFVLGIVSLARVHIEEGVARSATLGAAFSGAMLFAVWRLVPDAMLLAVFILIGVWWVSTRLVYDCTVLEQSIDASKKGLMQWIRPEAEETPSERPQMAEPEVEGVTGSDTEEKPVSLADKVDAWLNPTNTKFAPGAWVVYFSLGALPIFGFGQAFAPSLAPANRWYLFTLLVAYVFAALCLLVTTSFLGLRRYLQQRGVEMPLSMTGTWLGVGFGVVALTLMVVSILPRPNAEYELAKIPFYQDQAERTASRYSQGDDGTKDNRKDRSGTTKNQDQADEDSAKSNETRSDGKQPGDQSDPNAKQTKQGKSKDSSKQSSDQSKSDQQQKGDSGKSDSKQGDKSSDQGKSQDKQTKQQGDQTQQQDSPQGKSGEQQQNNTQKSDPQKGDSSQENGRQEDGEQGKTTDQKDSEESSHESQESESQDQSSQQSSSSNSFSFSFPALGDLVKLIVYAGVAALIVFIIWKFHEDIAKAWADFWNSLFGGKKKESAEEEEAAPVQKPRRRFSSFRNPFQDPTWKKKPAEEWVRYSFAALEAWADERGHARKEEQTPGEFAVMLEQHFDDLTENVRRAADLYGQVAYGSGKAPGETLEILRQLWQNLNRAV
ncbi:DUF4129 domain-containing protein [Blastopirellula marina]|uniref:Protein-glutamine gamma-glutamyltransferase-like C-terminal domain-containing protein n=1 Tax=Blastopirellula marina TaxID=124 RepID=A0A2S8G1G7_9BACT|nr:DUF4129 domain-containing protein [Blastopirellula marina]PQO38111.1 hypothetical protein C5Y98_08505 [Blastopirellula marina]PTL44767.1 DUF4129 domain-containing protein [Blastopirellula marina]